MALPNDYAGQACSLSRTLEVVGERWTLLIVRDAFFGVRRFGDFIVRLGMPRAVLSDRLRSLIAADVLEKVPGAGRREEYQLTAKGVGLWPVLRNLMAWGDDNYAPNGPRRLFRHASDDGLVDPSGHCAACGTVVDVADTLVVPGPGLVSAPTDDPLTAALIEPHALLQPLR
jgi:DNA-binding HxlR family transcriptional regulator